MERITPLAHFIDYGDNATVPLSDIHICPKLLRDTPPMAIKCGLKLNAPDKFHWTPDFVEVLVDVAAEGEILEAVFCGEVDGVKLIRSLKTTEQDLVKLIEEKNQYSANRPTGADTGVGYVTAKHLPVKERIEDNVTLHSDVAEGTEKVEGLVSSERNSVVEENVSLGTEWLGWSEWSKFPPRPVEN